MRIKAHLVNILIGNKPKGLDSLLSALQMSGGIPVGTLAGSKAGVVNTALLALAITAN